MPVLSDTLRAKIWRRVMAEGICPPDVPKAACRAAVDAADTWVDANAASYNLALPQPFRGAASQKTKALLLAYICLTQAEVL